MVPSSPGKLWFPLVDIMKQPYTSLQPSSAPQMIPASTRREPAAIWHWAVTRKRLPTKDAQPFWLWRRIKMFYKQRHQALVGQGKNHWCHHMPGRFILGLISATTLMSLLPNNANTHQLNGPSYHLNNHLLAVNAPA